LYAKSDETGEPTVDDNQLVQLAGSMRAKILLAMVANLSLGQPHSFRDIDAMRKCQSVFPLVCRTV
jgi:D-alanyl-D-alanine carboxypeptidase